MLQENVEVWYSIKGVPRTGQWVLLLSSANPHAVFAGRWSYDIGGALVDWEGHIVDEKKLTHYAFMPKLPAVDVCLSPHETTQKIKESEQRLDGLELAIQRISRFIGVR